MLNTLVSIIDKRLRQRQGIFEYTDCPRCIFRAQVATASNHVDLSDGTRLAAGSRLIILHLWNEHIPPFPQRGPTLGWARRMCDDFEISFEELATFLENRSDLDDVMSVAGEMTFGSAEQTELVARFAARYGFVRAVAAKSNRSFSQRLHRLGENILISMIVISQNPAALRADSLSRDRVPVYLRRTELMKRFNTPRNCSNALANSKIRLSRRRSQIAMADEPRDRVV